MTNRLPRSSTRISTPPPPSQSTGTSPLSSSAAEPPIPRRLNGSLAATFASAPRPVIFSSVAGGLNPRETFCETTYRSPVFAWTITWSGQGTFVALSFTPAGLISTTSMLTRSQTRTLPFASQAMPAAAVFISHALGIQYFFRCQSGSWRSKNRSGSAPGFVRSCL